MKIKVRDAFGMMTQSGSHTSIRADQYMVGTLGVLQSKGVTPIDCSRSLKWVEVPAMVQNPDSGALKIAEHSKGVQGGKAFRLLGRTSDNVLSRTAGNKAVPVKMSVGTTLQPCTAPEYLAQPQTTKSGTTGAKPLAVLRAGDTLYIVGHANANGGCLTYKCPSDGHVISTDEQEPGCRGWQHCAKWHIDPTTLTTMLIDEGLPKVRLDIVMLACFSGGVENDEWQTVQCYAQRVAGGLAGWGYRNLHVFGAKGLTSAGDSEMEVAGSMTRNDQGVLELDTFNKQTMRGQGNQPFYKRWFRFFRT